MYKAGEVVHSSFFLADALDVAPHLLKMQLVRQFNNEQIIKLQITEVEIYRGEEDLGCHASKGRTPRTEVMYLPGGCIYVYLIYGMYWLLNITTGPENHPQAILIRGTKEIQGPGRIGRALELDKSFYGEEINSSDRLWLEWCPLYNSGKYQTLPRVGIHYAGEYWANIPWRLKSF
ncbi:DNA-3-methyladenine glycosylase [Alkalitalea saponilacus]|uniref:Putative 3-methyladenine DNA glycosylase n=1 Tax=Alkalitalea saponilacus TaxID=889453 RepID=A0A1T5HT09_9BACT|nr:DNA-3-methyladenine glycosylase [Alkalitalea saponilacus]ASB49267.1 3-methyladenine DNA glycosylase [Alkalitalea saponilacus]SKC23752.1 DNA-3-methyladenine glycosylase [Alkalitalea saponilacus]